MNFWAHRIFAKALPCMILLMHAGCENQHGGMLQGLGEGEILYEVSYPELDPNGPLVMMLPESLKITFKKDKLKTSFKTAAGILQMDVISDANAYQMINTIKIFGDQYALKLDSSSKFRLGSNLGNFEIEKTGEKLMIADSEVEKLNLKYGDEVKPVYISDQFDVIDPNWCTVYGEIDAMLMEYDMEHYDILMHLKATRVRSRPIDEAEFDVNTDCQFLSEEEFNSLVRNNLKILLSDL